MRRGHGPRGLSLRRLALRPGGRGCAGGLAFHCTLRKEVTEPSSPGRGGAVPTWKEESAHIACESSSRRFSLHSSTLHPEPEASLTFGWVFVLLLRSLQLRPVGPSVPVTSGPDGSCVAAAGCGARAAPHFPAAPRAPALLALSRRPRATPSSSAPRQGDGAGNQDPGPGCACRGEAPSWSQPSRCWRLVARLGLPFACLLPTVGGHPGRGNCSSPAGHAVGSILVPRESTSATRARAVLQQGHCPRSDRCHSRVKSLKLVAVPFP